MLHASCLSIALPQIQSAALGSQKSPANTKRNHRAPPWNKGPPGETSRKYGACCSLAQRPQRTSISKQASKRANASKPARNPGKRANASKPARNPASKPTSKRASRTARRQASKQASKQASQPPRTQASTPEQGKGVPPQQRLIQNFHLPQLGLRPDPPLKILNA